MLKPLSSTALAMGLVLSPIVSYAQSTGFYLRGGVSFPMSSSDYSSLLQTEGFACMPGLQASSCISAPNSWGLPNK